MALEIIETLSGFDVVNPCADSEHDYTVAYNLPTRAAAEQRIKNATPTTQLYHCTINRQEPGSAQRQVLRTRCLADLDSHWWQVEHPETPGHWVGLPSWAVVLLGEVEPPEALIDEAGEEGWRQF